MTQDNAFELLAGCSEKNAEDVLLLQKFQPKLTLLSAVVIVDQYEKFSDDCGASWLIVDEDSAERFMKWLLGKKERMDW